MEEKPKSPRRTRKRSILKWVAGTVLGLLGLLVILFFVATSNAFLQRVVIPRVESAINADIDVAKLDLKPFSSVTLNQVRITTTGKEPLLTADRVLLAYDLGAILGGNILIHQIELDTPSLFIRYHTNGSSNLDPLLDAAESGEEDEADSEPGQEQAAQFLLEDLNVRNGSIRIVKPAAGRGQTTSTISNLIASAENVGNARNGKATVAADLRHQIDPAASTTTTTNQTAQLAANLTGAFDFRLTDQLLPDTLNGQLEVDVQEASGEYAPYQDYALVALADLDSQSIRQLALQVRQQEAVLGEIHASGPFDISQLEGKLQLDVRNVDRDVLNLFGTPLGWDFANTLVESTNRLSVASNASQIELQGNLGARDMQIRTATNQTPPLTLLADYLLSVNLDQEQAVLSNLVLSATQAGEPLLRADLPAPLTISWGQDSFTAPDSTLDLLLTNFHLADWELFLGTNFSSGSLSAHSQVQSRQGGKELQLSGQADLRNLSLLLDTNRVDRLDAALSFQGTVLSLNELDLKIPRWELQHQNQQAAFGDGELRVSLDTFRPTLTLNANADLPSTETLLNVVLGEFQASQGAVAAQLRLQSENETGAPPSSSSAQPFQAELSLSDFTGRAFGSHFDRYSLTSELNGSLSEEQIELTSAQATLQAAGNKEGALNAKANYHRPTGAAQIHVTLSDLGAGALRPFLEDPDSGVRLQSAQLNGKAGIDYNPQNESTFDADLQLTDLRLATEEDPDPNPLAFTLQSKAVLDQNRFTLKPLLLKLTPTDRAANELSAAGDLDLSDADAVSGNLTITSDGLDLSDYFPRTAAPAQDSATTPAPETEPAAAEPLFPTEEPEPVQLPVGQLTGEADIAKFILHDLVISNLTSTLQVNGSEVSLQPLSCSINGAPADLTLLLDLAVPGYRYQLDASLDHVPLAPLMSLSTSGKEEMYQGELVAAAKLSGQGITGPGIQQNLDAQFALSFTNASIQLLTPKTQWLRMFLIPIGVAIGVPDLVDQPIHWASFDGSTTNGSLHVRTDLKSAAFLAHTEGDLALAPEILTSKIPSWPLEFHIRRTLAKKAELNRIFLSNPNSTEEYIKLQNFLAVAGTLEQPEPKIDLDKKAIAGSILEEFADDIPGIDEGTGQLLQNLGGLLSGNRSKAKTNAPPAEGQPTEAPATNRFSPENLLDLFRQKDK